MATHNLYLANKLCQRAIWLERGVVRARGASRDVTAAYRDTALAAAKREVEARPQATGERAASRHTAPIELLIEGSEREGGHAVLTSGDPWTLRIHGRQGVSAQAWIDVRRVDGTLVSRLVPSEEKLVFASCDLLPGRFALELCDPSASDGTTVRARETLLVRGARRELGSVALAHEWLQ